MADDLVSRAEIEAWERAYAVLGDEVERLEEQRDTLAKLIRAAQSLLTCKWCGGDLPEGKRHKANARYCSPDCSTAAQRNRYQARVTAGTVGKQPAAFANPATSLPETPEA